MKGKKKKAGNEVNDEASKNTGEKSEGYISNGILFGKEILEVNEHLEPTGDKIDITGVVEQIKGNRVEYEIGYDGLREKHENTFEKNELNGTNKKTDITLYKKGEEDKNISIKSFKGKTLPTILNSSKGGTNFIYRVEGLTKKDADSINQINKGAKYLSRVSKIYELGGTLVFDRMISDVFRDNLMAIDNKLPIIMAQLLVNRYLKIVDTHFCKELVDATYISEAGKSEAERVLKKLLAAMSLGMFPKKKWDGNYETTDGFIILTKNKSIYHLPQEPIEPLENFLYNHSYFDSPSGSRHDFCHIYEVEGEFYMNLQLQIRLMDPEKRKR